LKLVTFGKIYHYFQLKFTDFFHCEKNPTSLAMDTVKLKDS